MAEILAIKPAAAEEGPVTTRLDKGVLRLTLANPPANALSLAVMAALTAELERAKADRAVRVIVL
ncbi:MAG: enoyl-CoA hydratase, partial [Mesorhizobium sp.]